MTPELREQIVTMLRAGASNAAVRDTLGVTVNVAAGLRKRCIGATMTAAAARALPKSRTLLWRQPITPTMARLLDAVPDAKAARARDIFVWSGFPVDTSYGYAISRKLVALGAVDMQAASGRFRRYRRASV